VWKLVFHRGGAVGASSPTAAGEAAVGWLISGSQAALAARGTGAPVNGRDHVVMAEGSGACSAGCSSLR